MAYRKTSVSDIFEDPSAESHLEKARRLSLCLTNLTGKLNSHNIFREITMFAFDLAGSESPAPFPNDSGLKGRQLEGERIRQMAKRLIGPEIADQQLSNEISAPYEVPQYPIEQIETKLIR